MAKTDTVSVELVKRLVRYNPETGQFFWLPRSSEDCARFRSFNSRLAGAETGFLTNEKGYRLLTINNIKFKAHRVAYAIMTGHWPVEIDHINGDRSDNRWCNLRNVTHRENRANTYGWKKPTTSKFIGVVRRKDCDRWMAQVTIRGKNHYLGLFSTEVEAARARDEHLLKHRADKFRPNFEETKS